MQYVRSISGSVGAAWNSINPATLSGAIDVIVVEQEDGSLACSPFHIRFGKWRLLRPSEKKVEFVVNNRQQDFPMKLGEGGEAFFVFETRESVPEALQTSPLVSPETSPQLQPSRVDLPTLQEPEPFELEGLHEGLDGGGTAPNKRRIQSKSTSGALPILQSSSWSHNDVTNSGHAVRPRSSHAPPLKPSTSDFSGYHAHLSRRLERSVVDRDLHSVSEHVSTSLPSSNPVLASSQRLSGSRPQSHTERSTSPAPPAKDDAKTRAMNLSKKLWTSNISNQVTESGDLMLDMTGYKSSEGEALQAELIARQLLSEELDGPYDIGALIGADENGNVWIYRSEEAKVEADKRASHALGAYNPSGFASTDAISDPGYHSDDARSDTVAEFAARHVRHDSDSAVGMTSQPGSPGAMIGAGDPNKNYAKTLRLTSDQLKTMDLQSGANPMTFTVNRATCSAVLWYWRHDVPIVISDIDGTITKSDVLGHAFTFIGRDWTHSGVAKLYTDISANGYNFLYLTSRSVGQADTTRHYLDGVVQDSYRLPKGPVILSPDRTIAALRREVYLRKPELFKMACLRDIMTLFTGHGGSTNTTESQTAGLPGGTLGANRGRGGSPFYAGFGNRLTDALSYRSVNIPSTRIFTINTNSEISLDLLSLNTYRTAYGSMREIVDHYFPAVGLLVRGGGEEFTDFNYWRSKPLDIGDFTDSDSEEEDENINKLKTAAMQRGQATQSKARRVLSHDFEAELDENDDLANSYFSDPRHSLEDSIIDHFDDDDDGDEEYEAVSDDGEDLEVMDEEEDRPLTPRMFDSPKELALPSSALPSPSTSLAAHDEKPATKAPS